ncbi:MAG TPA: glycerate kinase [Dermatophilaceae bacterium]|nr:glycerate kinase [Dermatophilaceae bacterium]
MRVVVAPDCFTGTLSATQAAEAMADGWASCAPWDELVQLPLSDGGPGFLDVLSRALPGRTVSVTVSDPLGRAVPAAVLLVGEGDGAAAYIESAQACGLHLLADGERDPTLTSSYGVGELIDAALLEGARTVVVGLGGSGTNDAGAGMLAALGAGSVRRLARGGLALEQLADDALVGLGDVRGRLRGVDLVLATDVDAPLLGFHGASAGFAAQKGATPEQAQRLERALGRFTEVAGRALPPTRDLLTRAERRLDREAGAGAAGGIGYGLLLLGGHRVSGVEAVLRAVGFEQLIRHADLVLTGEGSFDWQSLRGKVVAGVAASAAAQAVPTVVVAGQTHVGRREAMALGINGVYAVAERPEQLAPALADPAGTLAARTARVAATWSPRPA